MRFNLSNDGSPATIVALLLARSLDQLHPGAANPPVIALCVNQRKALRAPLSHQSLVGDVRLPYTKSLKALPFTTQATCFRGIVAFHADDEAILDDILDYQALMQRLDALPLVERQVDCAELVKARSRSISAVVSYVGKANLGDAERYVQHFDVVPSTALPSTQVPLTIELNTLNRRFCLDFIQYFQERDYFSAFAEQLRQNDIDYEILDDIEARFPQFYPSALRHD